MNFHVNIIQHTSNMNAAKIIASAYHMVAPHAKVHIRRGGKSVTALSIIEPESRELLEFGIMIAREYMKGGNK